MNHKVFEEKLKEELYSLVLSEEERSNSIAMIDRVYDSFNILFDYLLDGVADNAIMEEIDDLPSRVA